MKYAWQVMLNDGSIEAGIVDTFEEAIKILKDWYGDGSGEPDRVYTIVPVIRKW